MPKVVSISLYVHDLNKSVDFYTSHLGCKVKDKPTPEIIELEHDGAALVLCQAARPYKQDYGTGTVVGMFTPNLAEHVAKLRAANVEVLFDEAQPFPGGTFNAIRDPSGNVIELLSFS